MNRKEWLKTDAGKQYKAKTNKNYREKKKQDKKKSLKINKSFSFHFPSEEPD
tara:strand:- start:298 stop:453 length:156 start_codon:yes stop_codon:yes gene_type:complete